METPQNTSHIVFNAECRRLICRHCGENCNVSIPVNIKIFVKRLHAFEELHEDCKPQTSINMDIHDGQDKSV